MRRVCSKCVSIVYDEEKKVQQTYDIALTITSEGKKDLACVLQIDLWIIISKQFVFYNWLNYPFYYYYYYYISVQICSQCQV